ncbi:MAG: acyltransferase family protein [Hassallia sp.]
MRIFPLFYLILAVAAILNIPPVRETLTWHLLYLSNIYFAIRGDYNDSVSHLWSLAVEEQFYLVWPWLILFLPKKLLLPGIISVIFIGPAFRLISIMLGLNQVAIWVLTPSYLDILGLGSLLAYLNQQEQSSLFEKRFTKACLFIGCFLLLLIQILNRQYNNTIVDKVLGETAIGMICTWLVAQTAKGFSGIIAKVLEFPAVVYLGKISYGIYLIHLFTPYLIHQAFDILGLSAYSSKPIIMPVLSTLITLILAMISWHFFEKKINDLKKFFPYIN